MVYNIKIATLLLNFPEEGWKQQTKHAGVFSVLSTSNFLVIIFSFVCQMYGRCTSLRLAILLLNFPEEGWKQQTKHAGVFSVLSNCNFVVIILSFVCQMYGRCTTLKLPILLVNFPEEGRRQQTKHAGMFSVLSNSNFVVISLSYTYQLHGKMYNIKIAYLVTELKCLGAESNYGFYLLSYFFFSLIELSNQIKSKRTYIIKGPNYYSWGNQFNTRHGTRCSFKSFLFLSFFFLPLPDRCRNKDEVRCSSVLTLPFSHLISR